jgi:hypothetical protein
MRKTGINKIQNFQNFIKFYKFHGRRDSFVMNDKTTYMWLSG